MLVVEPTTVKHLHYAIAYFLHTNSYSVTSFWVKMPTFVSSRFNCPGDNRSIDTLREHVIGANQRTTTSSKATVPSPDEIER